MTVEGPVIDTKFATTSRGSPTFLDVGAPYPDRTRFTVLIWIENRPKFPAPPEQLYAGKTVCVMGLIQPYQGSPEIIVSSPNQIRAI